MTSQQVNGLYARFRGWGEGKIQTEGLCWYFYGLCR